jgi:hypothetical protein
VRHAARADGNQAQIVEALRKAGYVVWNIRWPVDLLVRCRYAWLPMEVKDPAQRWRLTDDQVQFTMTAGNCPVAVVTDIEGALRACAAVDNARYTGGT